MKLQKYKVVIPIELSVMATSEAHSIQIADSLSHKNIETLMSRRGPAFLSDKEDTVLCLEPPKSYYDIRFPQAED